MSPYGNYVIQKLISKMEVQHSRFIVSELLTFGVQVSGHRFGCRILCRLLETSSEDEKTIELFEEVLSEACKLCRHSYAHYVIESILENGLDFQKQRIMQALQAEPFKIAADRHGSYVIESALKNHPAGRASLLAAFVDNRSDLIKLTHCQSAYSVLKALLQYSEEGAEIRKVLNEEKNNFSSLHSATRFWKS